jgi:hypothetical protein
MAKIMLSADFILGILVGLFAKIRTNDDFVAWQDMKKTARNLGSLEQRSVELLSSIEIARKRCMAGILRAKHVQRKKCVPHHQALPLVFVLLSLASSHVLAQTINRHEGILIDVSGSIGKGGGNDEFFREHLFGVKKLLLTEPSNSRVWVSVITTESFGSVRSLVKGWTLTPRRIHGRSRSRPPSTRGEFRSQVRRTHSYSGRNRHHWGPVATQGVARIRL